MKALTLTQPFASLIAVGPKRIETRSWSTPYRGRLVIHAAKGLGPVGGARGFRDVCAQFLDVLPDEYERPDVFPLGALVATCELAHVIPTWAGDNKGVLLFSDIWSEDDEAVERLTEDGWWLDMGIPVAHWPQRRYGDFSPGRFAWMLERVRALPSPVPCGGKLGLWELPPDVLAQIA